MNPSPNSKLPESIPVLGQWIKVEATDDISFKRDQWGEYNPDTLTIRVSTHATKEQQFQTLFHEMLHAILHISGRSAEIDSDAKEEGEVTFWEFALSPLLQFKK